MKADPGQPWQAYYLDSSYQLHQLTSEPPLILDQVLAAANGASTS